MNRRRIIGAIKFPAFLLIWSAGLVLFMGQLYPADAALIRHADRLVSNVTPLAAIPSVKDYRALGASLEMALETSDLAGGRWQPDAIDSPIEISPATAGTDTAQPAPKVSTVAGVQTHAVESGHVESASAPRYAKRESVVAEETKPDPVAETKRAARLVLKSSRPEQAYALLIGEVSRARDDVEFLGLLAVAALQRQLFAEAQVVYRKLVDVDPRNDRWWAGLALTEKRLGMSARGSYEEVLKLADEGSRLRQLAVDELRQT